MQDQLRTHLPAAIASAVERLVDSPAGREALAQAEKTRDDERAAQRAAALAISAAAIAAAETRVAAASKARDKQLEKYRQAVAVADVEAAKFDVLSTERAAASFALERAHGERLHSLAELGNGAIDAAVFVLHLAELNVSQTLGWTPLFKYNSATGQQEPDGIREDYPERHRFVARCKALRAELEDLRLSTKTPREIEAQAEAALKFAQEGDQWRIPRGEYVLPPSMMLR